jgi:protein-S-isoprenylcysteine O-methyltransferase Ste14
MRIPVPWFYMLTYCAGLGLQHFLPLPVPSDQMARICFVAGIVLTAAGALLAFTGLGIFLNIGTTTVPFETASTLVTWGPYRYTRNPMYLGLFVTYVGVAAMQVQTWPILLLPLLFAYIHRIVIPVEEARLHEVFGEAYAQYSARVRRWI